MTAKNYILKPTYTPAAPAQTKGAPSGREDAPDSAVRKNDDPFIRAENEDDDGYDPYSDRQEERPLFERNPWD